MHPSAPAEAWGAQRAGAGRGLARDCHGDWRATTGVPSAYRRREKDRNRPERARSAQGKVLAAFGFRAGAEDAAVGRGDRQVVDAGLAAAHQAVLVELPQLVAVTA